MTRSLIGCFLAVLLSIAVADAAPITFFGQDAGPGDDAVRLGSHLAADGAQTAFFGALSSKTTLNLDLLPSGTTAVPFTLGAVNGNLQGGATVGTESIASGTDDFGGYPISGNVLWRMDANTFTITLSQPVTAIGFYGIDIGDAAGQLSVTLNGGAPVPVTLSSLTSGNVLYFGLTDLTSPFSTITINNSVNTDRFNFDDLTVGFANEDPNLAATPEPATLLLLGTSLAGMAGAAWKRRKAACRQAGLTSSAT
jgi:hypothetical protein